MVAGRVVREVGQHLERPFKFRLLGVMQTLDQFQPEFYLPYGITG